MPRALLGLIERIVGDVLRSDRALAVDPFHFAEEEHQAFFGGSDQLLDLQQAKQRVCERLGFNCIRAITGLHKRLRHHGRIRGIAVIAFDVVVDADPGFRTARIEGDWKVFRIMELTAPLRWFTI
jgi:hypothetical protein